MTRRILAFLAGAAILALTALASMGSVLAAPIGMWLSRVIQRARARNHTRATSWIGAVVACAVLFLGVLGYGFTRLPDGYVELVQQQTTKQQRDSTTIERIFQRGTPRSPASAVVEKKSQELAHSRAFIWWVTIVGGAMSAGMAALLMGSVGWVGTSLMLYGLTGRVPGKTA
jgi:predicted PurR-regulated permease PerM